MRLLLCILIMAVMPFAIHSGDFISGAASCPSSGNVRVSTTAYNLYQMTVSSKTANTGKIYFGSSSVDTSSGVEVNPGQSYNVVKPNSGIGPQTLYMACTVSADSVTWTGTR